MPRDLRCMAATLFMGSCRFLCYSALPQINQNPSYLTALLTCQFGYCPTLQPQYSYHSSAPVLFHLISPSEFTAVHVYDLIPQFSYPYSYTSSFSPTLPIYGQALESIPVKTQGWCFVLSNCKAQFLIFLLPCLLSFTLPLPLLQ